MLCLIIILQLSLGLLTELAGKVKQSVTSVCLSVCLSCPFLFTLFLEPTDLCVFVCAWVMTLCRLGLKVQVIFKVKG